MTEEATRGDSDERAEHALPTGAHRAGASVDLRRASDRRDRRDVRDTPIAGEHPLTLYVDKHELVTLMTLGAAPEALAIGYLRNQRLLDRSRTSSSVQVDWDVNAVVVKTRERSRRPRGEDARSARRRAAADRARCSAT